MISVSVDAIPVKFWNAGMRKLAMRVAERVLAGAGVPSTDFVEDGTITINVRRQCSDEERSRVREPYWRGKSQ